MQRLILACLSLVALLAVACGSPPEVDLSQLEQARTSAQEAAAFEHLRQNAVGLGFIPFDRSGEKLDGKAHPWEGELASVQLRVNGRVVSHEMIDPANIQILIGD